MKRGLDGRLGCVRDSEHTPDSHTPEKICVFINDDCGGYLGVAYLVHGQQEQCDARSLVDLQARALDDVGICAYVMRDTFRCTRHV